MALFTLVHVDPVVLLCAMGLPVQKPSWVQFSRGICILYVLLFDQYRFHYLFYCLHGVNLGGGVYVESTWCGGTSSFCFAVSSKAFVFEFGWLFRADWLLLTWDIFKIASISVSTFDESYSILALIRLSWISEVRLLALPQRRNPSEPTKSPLWVCWLSFVSANTVFVSILTANHRSPGFLWVFQEFSSCSLPRTPSNSRTTLLFLPLYGCQVRAIWLRRVLVVVVPMVQLAFGILSNCYFNRLTCSANGGLCGCRRELTRRSVLAKGESVLLTLCSGCGLLLAFLTTKEYDLYSKDFDELNAQTEERINQIMQRTAV